MARTPQPFKVGERVLYTHPTAGATRVLVTSIYQTRTGARVVVTKDDGAMLRVRPSQLKRR
jgi:hypothetical protein